MPVNNTVEVRYNLWLILKLGCNIILSYPAYRKIAKEGRGHPHAPPILNANMHTGHTRENIKIGGCM